MTMLAVADLARLAEVCAAAEAPADIFEAVAACLRERLGFGLLTMLRLDDDGEHVTRIFTTNPVAYPLSGTEALGSTAWGDHVLRQGRPFLGPDASAVRWAFPGDYELIESLGLGATINIPVRWLGLTLGSMNILDRAGRYGEPALKSASILAPILVPCFLAPAATQRLRR